MAGEFYRHRIGQHLEIGLRALEKLKAQDWECLHSRKLRSFARSRSNNLRDALAARAPLAVGPI